MKYPLLIEKSCLTWRQQFALKRLKLHDNGDTFSGVLTKRQKDKLIDYCKKNHIRYHIDNDFGKRNNYRAIYFESNRPVIGNRYFCAYCGILISRRNVTVDHIYPVHLADTDFKTQRMLSRKGWKSINDVRNLVAACRKCNSRKSDKTGLWILRGKIGKSSTLWILRHSIRIAIAGIAIYYCYMTYFA